MSSHAGPSTGFSRYNQTPKGMRSFENLIALANYQEALRDARKMVWRDRGEPAVELGTIADCLEHAARGGIRAGALGFTARAGFNFFVLLFRIFRTPRHFRSSLIRHAIFGVDSFRFAAMLGSFAALYKFILNSLPILLPSIPSSRRSSSRNSTLYPPSSPPSPFEDAELDDPVMMKPTPAERRRGRLSFRAQAHEVWVRKRTRRWYAVVAGAVAGGLSVLFEKRSRRIVISQQLFVRGLQGTYNAVSERFGFKIPYGSVIVFSLCCGQIMYAFLLRPDTIPSSYSTWIQNASKVSLPTVKVNRSLIRDGNFNFSDMEDIISHKHITPNNRTVLLQRLETAKTLGEFGSRYVPCEGTHPWIDRCRDVPLDRFFAVARWMLPIYGALHFVPAVLFKRAVFWDNPGRVILKSMLGTLRSSAFLGVFVVIYQTFFCWKHNVYAYLSSPNSPIKLRKEWVDILISKPSFWLGGLLSGLSLFVEERRRRAELAMYVLPKGMESAWVMARGKGYAFHTGKYGEALLCAIGMGMVMSTYQNDPQHLSGLVRRILYQFIGAN